MDKFVARHNIEHFQELLRESNDEDERRRLMHLLAEEEAKLAKLLGDEKSKKAEN